MAAANRENMANRSMMQGWESVSSFAGQLASLPSLYGNDPQAAKYAMAEQKYLDAWNNNTFDPNYKKAITGPDGKQIPFDQALSNSTFNIDQFYDYLNNITTPTY